MGWLAHVGRLWGPFWVLPGGLPLAYLVLVTAIGDFRPEHGLIVALCCVLAYASRKTSEFYRAAAPFLITGIAYDALRYPRAALVTAPRVLGCGLRAAEARIFGVGPDTTLQDWFSVHHTAALDLICALPYFAFTYIVFGYSIYLYFADRTRMHRFLWSYAVANFIAFACWLIVPAAPPWYLHAHGCSIDMAAAPSPAALLRVDALVGMNYFAGFYSRANSVFGALPSMHCAYPAIGLLTAWKHAGWKTRPLHIVYTLLMAFAAVYLDHHWVIDVLAGWAVAAVAVPVTDKAILTWKHWTSGLGSEAPVEAGSSDVEGAS